MYGKIEDGELIYAPLRYNDNGKLIYFNNSLKKLNACGYKLIVDNKPNYKSSKVLKQVGLIEDKNKIFIKYEIVEIKSEKISLFLVRLVKKIMRLFRWIRDI